MFLSVVLFFCFFFVSDIRCVVVFSIVRNIMFYGGEGRKFVVENLNLFLFFIIGGREKRIV